MSDEVPKLDLNSKNITEEQKGRLKQLFPEVFTEGKIDFDKLKQILGGEVGTDKERYQMTWVGKSTSIKIAQERTVATLKPCKVESVDFDSTQNIFIEGDNLEVLKLLQKSYSGKIKMIYIDPPYNTGNDFVYNDKFGEELQNYLKLTGQIDEAGRKLSTNTEASGRFHSNWLNMMYPRLFLAKNLLRDDGVLFVSINDIEQSNLKKICDEIFGEENFVDNLCVINNLKGNQNDAFFKTSHEYLVVYQKGCFKLGSFKKSDEELEAYGEEDELGPYKEGAYFRKTGKVSSRAERENEYFPIYVSKDDSISLEPVPGSDIVYPLKEDGTEGCWRWSPEKLKKNLNELVVKRTNSGISFYIKQRLNLEEGIRGTSPKTVFYKKEYNNGVGKKDIIDLFGKDLFGSYPKALPLIKDLVEISTKKTDYVLDFFVGSGTTAHAVLDLNKEDGGNRKFICVQLPEPVPEDSEAFKAGYKTIAEIAKERIRRVIKKVKEDKKQTTLDDKEIDLGFKVFKLSKSNFKAWDVSPEELTQSKLSEHVETVDKGSSAEDLLYEIILKDGLDLTEKINTLPLAGKTVYSIMDNTMLVCLDKEITLDLIKEMAKLTPSRVICLDEGFKENDQLKTNAAKIFKDANDQVVFRTV